MARYFFNTFDDCDHPDTTGVELEGIGQVRTVATKIAGEMIARLLGEDWRMNVRDSLGRSVLILRFSAIEPAR